MTADELRRDIEAFLAAGGTITYLDPGQSADDTRERKSLNDRKLVWIDAPDDREGAVVRVHVDTLNKIRFIEEKHGVDFWEYIRESAQGGATMSDVAAAISYERCSFKRLMNRVGTDYWFGERK